MKLSLIQLQYLIKLAVYYLHQILLNCWCINRFTKIHCMKFVHCRSCFFIHSFHAIIAVFHSFVQAEDNHFVHVETQFIIMYIGCIAIQDIDDLLRIVQFSIFRYSHMFCKELFVIVVQTI